MQQDSIIPLEYLISNYPSELENGDRYIPCKDLRFFDFGNLVDSTGNRNETNIFEYLT